MAAANTGDSRTQTNPRPNTPPPTALAYQNPRPQRTDSTMAAFQAPLDIDHPLFADNDAFFQEEDDADANANANANFGNFGNFMSFAAVAAESEPAAEIFCDYGGASSGTLDDWSSPENNPLSPTDARSLCPLCSAPLTSYYVTVLATLRMCSALQCPYPFVVPPGALAEHFDDDSAPHSIKRLACSQTSSRAHQHQAKADANSARATGAAAGPGCGVAQKTLNPDTNSGSNSTLLNAQKMIMQRRSTFRILPGSAPRYAVPAGSEIESPVSLSASPSEVSSKKRKRPQDQRHPPSIDTCTNQNTTDLSTPSGNSAYGDIKKKHSSSRVLNSVKRNR